MKNSARNEMCLAILLANLAVFVMGGVCSADGYEVVSQVPVGQYPTGMTVSPDSGHVYVASPSSQSIGVVDPNSAGIVASIPVNGGPRYPMLSPDGSKLLAPLTWAYGVAIISTATNTVVGQIPTGRYPSKVAFSQDGSTALVFVATTTRNNFVDIIDLGTLGLVARLYLPATTYDCEIVIRPDNKYAYVTNGNSACVTVVDINGKTIAGAIGVQVMPIDLALVPGTDKLLVVNYWSGTVSVVSTTTNTVVGTMAVGALPYKVKVRPQGDYAYVLCAGSQSTSVISCESMSVVGTIMTPGIQASNPKTQIALTPDGGFALVAGGSANCLYVVDASPSSQGFNGIVAQVALPAQPADVAVSADGLEAYVASYGAHVLSVVSLEDFNTPEGLNVNVPLLPGLSVTFAQVTHRGKTVADALEPDLGQNAYYGLCDASVEYSIETTATYAGPIDVHITYDDCLFSIGEERLVRLLQRQGGEWVDITSNVDLPSNTATGRAQGLGEFMLVKETIEGTGWRIARRIDEILGAGGPNPVAQFWLLRALEDLQGAQDGSAHNGALDKFAEGDLAAGMTRLVAVMYDLQVAALFWDQASAFLEVLAFSAKSFALEKVVEAQAAAGPQNPAVLKAWAEFNQGMSLLAQGAYCQAVKRFRAALVKALEVM
ncbi:MAG: YncE family protein [Planctomycetota bacterium]|nr:YncE family protein [Planctomycetota bacterium]